MLALNHIPPDLYLLSSQDYMCKPLAPDLGYTFKSYVTNTQTGTKSATTHVHIPKMLADQLTLPVDLNIPLLSCRGNWDSECVITLTLWF
jgi:hypothetical protein